MKKRDCHIYNVFTPAQIQELSTPTYKSREERDQKKTVSDSPASATPTLMAHQRSHLLGWVHKESSSVESTASKKKTSDISQAAVRKNPAANPGLMTSRT